MVCINKIWRLYMKLRLRSIFLIVVCVSFVLCSSLSIAARAEVCPSCDRGGLICTYEYGDYQYAGVRLCPEHYNCAIETYQQRVYVTQHCNNSSCGYSNLYGYYNTSERHV